MAEPARWLSRDAAAAYLTLRPDHLARLVRIGKLPVPSYHLGPKSPMWDREALDALFGGKVASRSQEQSIDETARRLAADLARGVGARRPRRPEADGRRHGQGIPLPQAR